MIPRDALQRTLVSALRAAGEVHRRAARRPIAVAYKGRVDIVTRADKEAEKAVVRAVRKSFPDHGFLMEESGAVPSSSGWRWIVDPLDGTINFAHGVPAYCVSIGVERDGVVVAGGVYDAVRDELFLAARGKGATLNGGKIHVSAVTEMHKALLATGFPYDRQERAAFYVERVRRGLTLGRDIRRMGAAAIDLAYVACGRFDAYWEFSVKPWDVSAGRLLVEEAGGKVTRHDGSPYSLADTSQTLATNGRLHGRLVRMLTGRP